MHAFKVRLGNFRVTLSTGRRDSPMVDGGMGFLRRENCMTSMTIRATRRISIAIGYRPSMHALAIEFHGMCEGYLVPGEELVVAVAGRASIGHVFLGNGRGR